MSWLGTGATASLVSNDIVVYGGGESLWTLSLANQTWNEAWTSGQTPPHGLRFHTATSLRLAPNFGEPGAALQQQQQQQPPNRSQSNDSTVSSPSTIGAMIVLGGEPRASADLFEATQHGDKLNMHVLKVRQRAWTVSACTGDVPENRCMHTTTKLRGSTLAVYGGRPLGRAHPTSEEASPVFEDTNELRAKLASDGFYDVYIIDANVGVWRKITPSTDPSNGGPIYSPCLWGHAAFATSVFPPRRSQTGDYRHRIDLVIQGGFDISPSQTHQSQVVAFTSSHNQQQHAFVLQPVSETQPTLLKWGIAPLAADDNRSNSEDGAYTLHAATSADTVREGAHPAFFIGGFNMKTEADGEIGLQPIAACGRISLRGSWTDGPRGQIASLPPLQTLFQSTARPLLLFYSDQLIVLENTNRFWLLDLQLPEDEMEWASMDTTLGPNEDVERWRIGCPLHPDFSVLNNNNNEEDGNGENQQIDNERQRNQQQQEEKQKQQEQEKMQADEKRRSERRKKRQERDEKKLQRQREIDERRNDPNQKPPKPKAGDVRGEWKCVEDPKTGRNYYVNATTRKSTWKIEETSFIEPLPSDTQYPDKLSDDYDNEDLDSTADGETDKEYQQRMKNTNNNNNSPTWRDTTQGESINGYETSMMNPEYDRENANNFNNNNYHQGSQAGTPQQLSRFLSGGGPNNNDQQQQQNNNNNSTGNNTWWNTAADAKSRNARDQSRSQAGLNHSLDRPQDHNGEETEENNNHNKNIQKSHQQKHSEKPPLAASAPSRTPTSQIGPPSHLPTPSIWNEPHLDLPIDNLLKMIDGGDLERDRQLKRRNSLLNSMLTEDSVARKKRQEDERKMKAWELLEQEKLTETNNQKNKRGGYYAAEEEEKKIPDVDPAEVLQYPFDLETALLLPHSTILRARKIYIEKQKSETQVPKSRDIDIKKFLQQYTHYESASDDGRKMERQQQHQQRHHFLNSNSTDTNSFNQFNQQRTVFDMLPSMLVGGKFQEYVEEVSTSRFSAVGLPADKENNNNNNHDDANKSSASPGLQHNSNNRFGRPTALVAADFSRTGSAIHQYGDASSSRTSSTPHIAAQIFTDLIPEQHLDGVRKAMMKMQNSRSVSQQQHPVDRVKGLGTHHVSQSIRDMVNNNDENEYF